MRTYIRMFAYAYIYTYMRIFTKHPSVLPTHPPNIILAAAKLNSRPVFIIIDNPSITETKQMPQNSPKQYGNIQIKESNRE